MDTPFKRGQPVKQVVVPIEGTVRQVVYDEQAETFRYRVGFTLPGEPDADGDPTTDNHERWFDHKDLTSNEPAKGEEASS